MSRLDCRRQSEPAHPLGIEGRIWYELPAVAGDQGDVRAAGVERGDDQIISCAAGISAGKDIVAVAPLLFGRIAPANRRAIIPVDHTLRGGADIEGDDPRTAIALIVAGGVGDPR